jgi:hypothetical protein
MSTGINWRDTYRPSRFFIVDGRISLLVLPMIIHVKWWTVAPTVLVAVTLWYFEKRRDMDVAAAYRMVRTWLCGAHRPAKAPAKRRFRVDYDRRDERLLLRVEAAAALPAQVEKMIETAHQRRSEFVAVEDKRNASIVAKDAKWAEDKARLEAMYMFPVVQAANPAVRTHD